MKMKKNLSMLLIQLNSYECGINKSRFTSHQPIRVILRWLYTSVSFKVYNLIILLFRPWTLSSWSFCIQLRLFEGGTHMSDYQSKIFAELKKIEQTNDFIEEKIAYFERSAGEQIHTSISQDNHLDELFREALNEVWKREGWLNVRVI